MELFWADSHDDGVVREVAAGNEWRKGQRVSPDEPGRTGVGSLIHDIVRTLLDLGAPRARAAQPEPDTRGGSPDPSDQTADGGPDPR